MAWETGAGISFGELVTYPRLYDAVTVARQIRLEHQRKQEAMREAKGRGRRG